jgi:hypothetical protein
MLIYVDFGSILGSLFGSILALLAAESARLSEKLIL